MTEPIVDSEQNDVPSQLSRRVVHDLRAPLIVATGFLDELLIYKQNLVKQLLLGADEGGSEFSPTDVASEVEAEIGLCLTVIKESMDELDAMILNLRKTE